MQGSWINCSPPNPRIINDILSEMLHLSAIRNVGLLLPFLAVIIIWGSGNVLTANAAAPILTSWEAAIYPAIQYYGDVHGKTIFFI